MGAPLISDISDFRRRDSHSHSYEADVVKPLMCFF